MENNGQSFSIISDIMIAKKNVKRTISVSIIEYTLKKLFSHWKTASASALPI